MSTTTQNVKQTRCVIYVRISKDRENETSTTTQEAEARAYATRKGWDVAAVCVDPGRSAFKRGVKRPELEQALSMVETGQAQVLLVWKLDRFARSVVDFFDYWQRLQNAGGEFASVVETFDTTTPMGRLMILIVASFAEMESDMKRERTQSWNDHLTANGSAPLGPRPYGYVRTGSHELTIDPVEADLIREAAAHILKGDSLRATIKALKPVSSKSTDEHQIPMSARGLRSVLMSPTTAGLRKSDAGFITGSWAPILDRETWEAVTVTLGDPSRKLMKGNHIKHLLSGIMSCGACGGMMGIRKWKPAGREGQWRYTCRDCNHNSIFQGPADNVIRERIATVDQATWAALRTQGKGYDPTVIAAIEADQAEIAAMLAADAITLAQFKIMNAGLTQRMASATGEASLNLPDVDNIAEAWDSLLVLDQRQVISVLFDEVKLEPSNGHRGPDRIFVRWAV